MILKIHLRVFTNDMDESLTLLKKLIQREPDYRFRMEKQGWEIAGIGDFCVVAGEEKTLKPIRATQGPVVVEDLDACMQLLTSAGAKITEPEAQSETGRYFYARHSDGSEIEYVEWKPELKERILGKR